MEEKEEKSKPEQTLIFTDFEGKRCFFSIIDQKLHLAAFDTSESRDMGKIFVGKVRDIKPALKAAFAEYRKGTNGFLPLPQGGLTALKGEMRMPVQITKDAVKTKDAILSGELSVTGLYCVITNKEGGVTFSRKIPAKFRKKLDLLCAPFLPEGFTCIVRTNVLSLDEEDYTLLTDEIVQSAAELTRILQIQANRTVYSRLYAGTPFVKKQLSKINFSCVTRIITDSQEEFDQISQMIPLKLKDYLRLYTDTAFPLSALYGLRAKLTEALCRTVWLKSGGYLVIEPTEALTVIDVNSGKNTKKLNKKQLISLTNKEAAEAIPYILTSRNITGIVIVDFINTGSDKEDEALLKLMRRQMLSDYVKTDVVDMTALGLVEITRQKGEIPLSDQLSEVGLYGTFKH